MAIWKNHPDLMERLYEAQNHEANINQDIVTFCAFFETRAELERHVLHYENRVLAFVPKKRGRRA